MKKVLLAAAALALSLTQSFADGGYAQKAPSRQARKTAVSQAGRSGGGTGGATFYGTPVSEASKADNPMNAYYEKVQEAKANAAAGTYNGNRTAGYSNRGLTGGGLGSYGRGLAGSRKLNEHGVPDVIVPGQLYRSAGLGYTTSEPETKPTLLAVEAGNRIKYEDMPAGLELREGKGVHHGPKDKLPGANPTLGSGASGFTGVTENQPTININAKNKNDINLGF
jgi:hypothetical protein